MKVAAGHVVVPVTTSWVVGLVVERDIRTAMWTERIESQATTHATKL